MIRTRKLPKWLYESTPFLYLAGGIAAEVLGHDWVALASGALLIMAGLSIGGIRLMMRLRPLQAGLAPSDTLLAPLPERPAGDDRESLRGTSQPGHPGIAQQHRVLEGRARALRMALSQDLSKADIELEVHQLVDTLAVHLQTEVDAMVRLGMPGVREREADQQALMQRADAAVEQFQRGKKPLHWLVEQIAGGLVDTHLASPHPEFPGVEETLKRMRAERLRRAEQAGAGRRRNAEASSDA